jgi:hypothetical protein
VENPMNNPFPRIWHNGTVILDELCHCGHLRSEHTDTISFGHGMCERCPCLKFTWFAMVTKPGKESRA